MFVKAPNWRLQIVVAFLSTAMSSARAGDPAIERIRSEWNQRQDRVRSFIVEWDEQRTVPARMGGVGKGGYVPLQDTVYSIRHRMVGSGNRLRLDRNGLQYDSTANDFIEKKFVRVFDGRERRELFQKVTNPDNPGGFLNKGHFCDDGSYLGIQPVVFTFRPLRTELGGVDLSAFTMSDERGSVHGIACQILEHALGPKRVDRLWIAKDGDFRILRRQLGKRERPLEELTLSYEQIPQAGWHCTGWTYLERSGGETPAQISVCKAHKFDINTTVDEAEFQFEFPAGALVLYEGSRNYSIALRDGSLRPVTSGEMAAGISRETLMKTPPLSEATSNRRWSTTLIAGLSAAVVVIAMSVRWYRRRVDS